MMQRVEHAGLLECYNVAEGMGNSILGESKSVYEQQMQKNRVLRAQEMGVRDLSYASYITSRSSSGLQTNSIIWFYHSSFRPSMAHRL